MVAAAAAALFAGSILADELSHAIVAVREGVAVDSIVLWMFGGVAKLRSNAHTARSELRIAIAGPATSLVIGATAIVVAIAVNASGRFDLAVTAVGWLGVINLVLALFNLMPGAPLDGGRVLTAVLWRRSGDEQLASRRSAGLGRILGQVLVGLGIIQFVFLGPTGLWTALVGWLIMSMARMEMVQSEMHDVLHGVRVADVMTSELTVASSSLTVAELMNGPWPQRRVSSFPIVDAAGRAVGVVSLRQIGALPPDRWTSTR